MLACAFVLLTVLLFAASDLSQATTSSAPEIAEGTDDAVVPLEPWEENSNETWWEAPVAEVDDLYVVDTLASEEYRAMPALAPGDPRTVTVGLVPADENDTSVAHEVAAANLISGQVMRYLGG